MVAMAYIEAPSLVSGDTQYGYVISSVSSVRVDGRYRYQFTVWTADGEVEITTTDTTDTISKGDIVAYEMDDDYASVSTVYDIDTNAAAIISYNGDDEIRFMTGTTTDSNGYTVIDGSGTASNYLTIDDDTVILYIDADAVEGVEGTEMILADEIGDNYMANAIYVAGSDNAVDLIVYDVANNILCQ